jgi:hypothetical protein
VHNDTVFVQKVLVFAQYKSVLHSFYPRFYRRTLIICNYYCCLFNFPTQNHKKAQFPRRRHADCGRSVLCSGSAQPRPRLQNSKKAPFPRGGTPNVVAQARLSSSTRFPIRSNGLQQLLGLPIRSNGLQQLLGLPIRSNGLSQRLCR